MFNVIKYRYEEVKENWVVQVIFLTTIAYVFFFLFNNLDFEPVNKRDYLLKVILICAISILGVQLKYELVSKAFAIIYKTLICMFIFYALAAYISFLPETRDEKLIYNITQLFRAAAIGFGILSFWRPTFGLVTIMYLICQRPILQSIYGVEIAYTDYLVVAEIALLLLTGFVVFALNKQFVGNDKRPFSRDLNENNPEPFQIFILIVTALHFTNYFNSGIKKILLEPGVLSWLMENPTQNLILSAEIQGLLPISEPDWLWGSIYEWFLILMVPSNAFILLIQLGAIVAIIRVRWTIIMTLLYDLSHIAIYLASGVFFWKWIILNFAIVVGLSTFRDKVLPRSVKVILVGIVACGWWIQYLPGLFSTVSLGWYDASAFNYSRFIAISDDGKEYVVPTNYFLQWSKNMAQDDFEVVFDNRLDIITYTVTEDYELFLKTLSCSDEITLVNSSPTPLYNREALSRLLKRHHKYILTQLDDNGIMNYDLYPHHIWSTPWVFEEFKQLDKHKIVKYKYVNTPACLLYDDNKVILSPVGEDASFYINVR